VLFDGLSWISPDRMVTRKILNVYFLVFIQEFGKLVSFRYNLPEPSAAGFHHSVSFLYSPVVEKNSIPGTWKAAVFFGPSQGRNDVCETVREP
jgi:hypothetical protein